MSKQTLSDRLLQAMDGPPAVSAADLARACQVKPPSVSNWLSGKTKALKGESLTRAARKLGVSAAWLGLGEGPMKPTRSQSAESTPSPVAGGTPHALGTANHLVPEWVAEVSAALRMHAEANGRRFDIETPEGSDDFTHWYAVRALLPSMAALDNVIELESRRTQKGATPRGYGSSSAARGTHGSKR